MSALYWQDDAKGSQNLGSKHRFGQDQAWRTMPGRKSTNDLPQGNKKLGKDPDDKAPADIKPGKGAGLEENARNVPIGARPRDDQVPGGSPGVAPTFFKE
jgi:hypothetical protein